MSETKRTAKLTFGYSNTDFTRTYKFDGLSAAGVSGVKAAVLAVNASLTAGTDGGLSTFFRSDDYDVSDPDNPVGIFNGIVASQTIVEEDEVINLNE